MGVLVAAVRQHKQSKNLMEDIEVMRGKQKELQREVVDYRQRLSDLRRVSNAFKTDLYHTTQHILVVRAAV